MKKAFSIILAVLMMLSVGIVNISAETTDIDIPVQVTYTVRENTAPKIVGADDVTILKGTSLDLLEGIRVEDPDEEDKNLSIDFGPAIDFSKADVGVYEIHYQVEDNECASDHVVRKITVVNSNAYVDEDSPVDDAKVSVDNVVLLIDGITTDNSTLTQQQIEDIKNGTSSAIVGLKVSDSSVSSEDKLLIKDKVKQELSVENPEQIVFMNVELLCTVTDANGQTIDTKNITETNQEVTVSVQMPEELINKDENVKREYSIARVHYSANGPETTILKADYNPETGMLSFKTNKFSLYAIVYKDTNIDSGSIFIPSKKKPVVNTEGTMISVSSLDLRPKTNNGTFNLMIDEDDLFGQAAYVTIGDAVLTSEEGNTVTIKANSEQSTIIDGGEYEISYNVVDENKKPGVYTGEIIVKVSFKTGEALVNDVVYSSLQDALNGAKENDTVYILKNITGDRISINKSLTMEGRNYSIEDNNSSGRAVWIDDTGVSLTINNLTIDGKGVCQRGLQVNNLDSGEWNYANIVLNNCKIINMTYYAINFNKGTSVDMEINNSYIQGWAAINAYGTGNKIVVNNSKLEGVNDKGLNAWNNFATICLEGDTTGQSTLGSSDYDVIFNNCEIIAKQTTGNKQRAIGFNSNSKNSTVSLNNTIITLGDEENCSFAYDNGGNNVIYINGEIIHQSSAFNCWYSNGSFNSDKNGGMYTNFLNPIEGEWIDDGEGIILEDDIVLDNDITCQMASGTFYLYFDGHTINGHIILNHGVSVISDTQGLSNVFAGGVITETDNGNGTYTYACSEN